MKKNKGKNWYSGDVVKDLVDNVERPDRVEGNTQEDSNYQDEMYSEEQLARQAEMDNIFRVDNVPSGNTINFAVHGTLIPLVIRKNKLM